MCEGDFAQCVFNTEWLYVMDLNNTFFRMRIPDGQLTPLAVLNDPVEPFSWYVYGDELAVFVGSGCLYGVYLPTGDQLTLGLFPHRITTELPKKRIERYWPFTNKSYAYQLMLDVDDDIAAYKEVYLYCGTMEKLYRVVSGMDANPFVVEDFFPLDENGVPLLGDNFVEVTPAEAGVG